MSTNEPAIYTPSFVHGLVAERDRLREQNTALLFALEKIRAAYTRSTNKFAVQTLDAMDEIAQQAILATEGKP